MSSVDNLEFYFKRINDAMISYANNELKELDLTYSQMEVICFLMENKYKKVYQKDIEKHLHLTHPTVIGLLKRLKSKGLIIITTSSEDKRKRNIKLTDKILDIEEKINFKRQEMEEHVKRFLNYDEIIELERLLKVICENVIYNL